MARTEIFPNDDDLPSGPLKEIIYSVSPVSPLNIPIDKIHSGVRTIPGPVAEATTPDLSFLSPPQGPEELGRLGPYRVLAVLGQGGMGLVLEAHDPRLGRSVALKVLRPELASDVSARQRFHREAEAAAALDHPNIVPIYEIGEFQGRQWLSMMFVKGGSLAECLAQTRTALSSREMAGLLAVLARAVHHAHQRGILHRDLKPANVLLANGGEDRLSGASAFSEGESPNPLTGPIPRITDFGLARRLESGRGLTQTGTILGTPCYMAPEQAWGQAQELTTAVDVYSLGSILYELLTGQPPFFADNVLETLVRLREEKPVAPRSLNPGIDPDLETICLKCLQKEPWYRYSSAAALAEDLERWQAGEPIHARRAPWAERAVKWARRRPAIAALLMALVAVSGLGFVGIVWKYLDAEEQRQRAEAREGEAITALSDRDEALARAQAARDRAENLLANNRLQLALAAWNTHPASEARAMLDRIPLDHRSWDFHYLRGQFEGSTFTWPMPFAGIHALVASPDGRHVAAAVDTTVRIFDLANGREVHALTGHMRWLRDLSFSADGKWLASVDQESAMTVWNVADGRVRSRMAPHAAWGVVGHLTLSPDGRYLAHGYREPRRELCVWDVETARQLFVVPGIGGEVIFTPDSRQILGISQANRNHPTLWELPTGKEVRRLPDTCVLPAAFSPGGRTFACCSYHLPSITFAVEVFDAPGGRHLHTLKPSFPKFLTSLTFSPDGQLLAAGHSLGMLKVWRVATGEEWGPLKGAQEVASPRGGLDLQTVDRVTSVVFSPDGQRLVTTHLGPRAAVRVWDLRGEPGDLLLPRREEPWNLLAWSADGRRLAQALPPATRLQKPRPLPEVQIWDTHAGKALLTLPTPPGHVAALSNDGRRLALGGMTGRLVVWDVDSRQQLFSGQAIAALHLAFNADGSLVAACASRALPQSSVQVWNVDTGRRLCSLESPVEGLWRTLAFSSDSQLVALGRSDGQITIHDLTTDREVSTFTAHGSSVSALAFGREGRLLASGAAADREVRIWDLTKRDPVRTLRCRAGRVQGLVFDPSGRRLVGYSDDQHETTANVQIWDLETQQETLTFPVPRTDEPRRVSFSPEGRLLLAPGGKGTLAAWRASEPPDRAVFQHTSDLQGVVWSGDGRLLAAIGSEAPFEGRVAIWDLQRGEKRAAPPDLAHQVSLSGDGRFLVGVGRSQGFWLWNTTTEQVVRLSTAPTSIHRLAVNADGTRAALFTVGQGLQVRLWDTQSQKEVRTMAGKIPLLRQLAFHENGRWLVGEDEEGQTTTWDIATGESVDKASPPLRLPALAPDRRTIAWPDGDTVRLRNTTFSEGEWQDWQRRLRVDAAWQAAQAEQQARDGQWYAAAFHWRQALLVDPDDPTLWRRLALCQLSAGDEAAYLATCAGMLQRFTPLADLIAAVRVVALPFDLAHGQALLARRELPGAERTALVRVCMLRPGAVAAPARLLPFLPAEDRLTRGAVLHRAGRHPEALKLTSGRAYPVDTLYTALARHARSRTGKGALTEAIQLLSRPAPNNPGQKWIDRIPWSERVEIEILLKEASQLMGGPGKP